jgi:hypothetical protein
MKTLIIAMAVYIGIVSWLIWDGYRIEATVHEAQQTVGFDHYLTWVSQHDRTPKEAIRKAEAWAMSVEPGTIDEVNIKNWVKYMQRGNR